MVDVLTLKEKLGNDWWDSRETEKYCPGSIQLKKLLDPYKLDYKNLSETEIHRLNWLYAQLELEDVSLYEGMVLQQRDILDELAELGHYAAQFVISIIEKNTEKKRMFVYRSAAQGYMKALNDLYGAYLAMPELFDVTRNIGMAKELCCELVKMGDERSEYDMVAAYLFGTFGEREPKEMALGRLERLADEGNMYAVEFLDNIKDCEEWVLDEIIRG